MKSPGTLIFGRIRVSFTGDPDTPVMVYMNKEHASATYHCALGEGDVDGFELTPNEMNWLASLEEQATAWFDSVRCG